jgi:hypothetical protein
MRKLFAVLGLVALLGLIAAPVKGADEFSLEKVHAAVSKGHKDVSSPSNAFLFPTSANTHGQYGSWFKTRLCIFNPVNVAYSVTVGLIGSNGLQGKNAISFPAYGYYVSDNALQDLFGIEGAGALALLSNDPGAVFIATLRVYNDTANGRFYIPVPIAENIVTPGTLAVSIDLVSNSGNRTNIGVVNLDASPAVITAGIIDTETGGSGSYQITIPGYSWKQVPLPVSLNNGLILWGQSSGNVVPFTVVNDNRTSDGTCTLPFAVQ